MGTAHWIYISLLTVASIAFLTKRQWLRPVILLLSLIIVGFLQMACPSPSGSIQNFILNIAEFNKAVPFAITILIVIVPTLFLGKIFCGWVCHKGALQEFLFQEKFKISVPERLDKTLRYGKYVTLLAIVILPLFFHYRALNSSTRTFQALFNLGGPLSALILLGLTLLSSIFIYRPFCRYICPIGALLGLVSLIGIRRLKIDKEKCSSCMICQKKCNIGAISANNDKILKIDSRECLACGECRKTCTKQAIN